MDEDEVVRSFSGDEAFYGLDKLYDDAKIPVVYYICYCFKNSEVPPMVIYLYICFPAEKVFELLYEG